jgi:hypothetical protein
MPDSYPRTVSPRVLARQSATFQRPPREDAETQLFCPGKQISFDGSLHQRTLNLARNQGFQPRRWAITCASAPFHAGASEMPT